MILFGSVLLLSCILFQVKIQASSAHMSTSAVISDNPGDPSVRDQSLITEDPYSMITEVLPYHMLSCYCNKEPMEQLVSEIGRPRIVIEVGSYMGSSTAHLASLVHPDGGKVYAVDWWRGLNYLQEKPVPGSHQSGYGHSIPDGRDMYQQFLSNMIHLGFSKTVMPVRAKSQEAAVLLKDSGISSANLIYIDADHSYTSVLQDCRAWYPFVSSRRGILCGDDWGWSMPALGEDYILGVQRAVREFAKEHDLDIFTNGTFWFLKEKN